MITGAGEEVIERFRDLQSEEAVQVLSVLEVWVNHHLSALTEQQAPPEEMDDC